MDDGRSTAMWNYPTVKYFSSTTVATGMGVRDAEEEEENRDLLLIMKKSDSNAKRMQKK